MSASATALLGEIAAMSQKAATQTLAVVGDDTAISANQLIGGQPGRKLPMVLRVVKGSLRNKAVIIPVALALSYTMPGLILASLAVGGTLLCYDSVEKLIHKKLAAPKGPVSEAYANDHAAWENRHVKSALKTDLVLSAETTVVSLWAVAASPFIVQAAAVVAAGLAMTAGVYATVAGIIKMDDIGSALSKTKGDGIPARLARTAGKVISLAAPKIINVIGALGTAAMFVVGGTMLVHGIPGGEHFVSGALGFLGQNMLVHGAAMAATNAVLGMAAGLAAVPVMKVVLPPLKKAMDFGRRLIGRKKTEEPDGNDADDAAPAPLPKQDSLKNLPDVKAALQQAAAPAPASKPEIKAAPAAPKPPAP